MNTTTIHEPNEKAWQLFWTAFILMFFLIQAIIWTVAISITAGDASHAVVAGYDEQALNWDKVKRQREASVALGWKAKIDIESTGDIRGTRSVTLTLTDSSNRPIQNAIVRLEAFHRGRIAEKQTIALMPDVGTETTEIRNSEPEVYTGFVLIRNSGVWEFKISATRGNDEFFFEQQLDIESNRNL